MFRRFLARLRHSGPPVRLTLYTRPDCPLCDEMKAEIARAALPPHELEELDITRDPELLARHGLSIPVLAIEGRAAFKGHLSAAELERKLARRLAEAAAEGAR